VFGGLLIYLLNVKMDKSVVNMTSRTLAQMAYSSLPQKTFNELNKAQSDLVEKPVFDMIQQEVRKNHKDFSRWFLSTEQTSEILYKMYLYSQFVLSTDYKQHSIRYYWKSFKAENDVCITAGELSSSFSKSEGEKRRAKERRPEWSKREWLIYKTFHLIFQSIYNRGLYKRDLESFNFLIEVNKTKHNEEKNFISEDDMKFLKNLNIRDKTNNKMIPFQIYIILNRSFYNKRLLIEHGDLPDMIVHKKRLYFKTNMKDLPKAEIKKILNTMNLFFAYIRYKRWTMKIKLDYSLWEKFIEYTSLTEFKDPELYDVMKYLAHNKLNFGTPSNKNKLYYSTSDDSYISSGGSPKNSESDSSLIQSSRESSSREFSSIELIEKYGREKVRSLAEDFCSSFPLKSWSKSHWILYNCFFITMSIIKDSKYQLHDYIDGLKRISPGELPKNKKLKDFRANRIKKFDTNGNTKNQLLAVYTFLNEHFDKETFEKAYKSRGFRGF
jgi:hypothetical protein